MSGTRPLFQYSRVDPDSVIADPQTEGSLVVSNFDLDLSGAGASSPEDASATRFMSGSAPTSAAIPLRRSARSSIFWAGPR